MPNYLADTMAVVSHFANRRLGHQAAEIFRETDGDEHQIFLSAVTLMEILYLSERKRINIGPAELLAQIQGSTNYAVLPLDANVILTAATIADVPELHDRMIAATGKYYQLPVITNDPVLAKSKHITTIW
ncbi:MAG: PIN domain-containing protein [Chloroflexota bacterium]